MARRRHGPPADPGLQQERTALSWERTGLALLAGCVLFARLAFTTLGIAVVVPAMLAGGVAVWVVLASLRRGRLAAPHPGEPGFDALLRDGILPALASGVVVTLAAIEVTSLLLQLFGT